MRCSGSDQTYIGSCVCSFVALLFIFFDAVSHQKSTISYPRKDSFHHRLCSKDFCHDYRSYGTFKTKKEGQWRKQVNKFLMLTQTITATDALSRLFHITKIIIGSETKTILDK